MTIPSNWVRCDGCGLPGSPAHIAERVNRLELATRYRPIHIGILFVAAAPSIRPRDDFYRPPESREFFDPLMEALGISASGNGNHKGAYPNEIDVARLVEFQHGGYYLSYLSECPLSAEENTVQAAVSRLGPTLLRRVRFNYRPKQIVVLGSHLGALRDIFSGAATSSISFSFLDIPETDMASAARLREALAGSAARDILASNCDRIGLKQP